MITHHMQKCSFQHISKTKMCLMGLFALSITCFSTLALSDHGEHELTNKALEEDSASAQYKLGIRYLNGAKGEPADIAKAVEWLTLASEQGFAAASHRLAMLHYEGKHSGLSREEALSLLEQAADKGHAKAQEDLASVMLNPPPIKKEIAFTPKKPKKIKTAKKKKAAAPKKSTAPVVKIDRKDTKLVTRLAQEGNAEAQSILAGLLRNGEGVPKDKPAAINWFKKSAEQGYSEAMFELGDMYSKGEGIKRSRSKAKRWYKKAEAKGHTRARLRLNGCKDC